MILVAFNYCLAAMGKSRHDPEYCFTMVSGSGQLTLQAVENFRKNGIAELMHYS